MKFREYKVDKLHIPVYVPGDNGEVKLEVAEASLAKNELKIKFNDRLPAQAIQRMIANEILMGLAFVMLKAEEENAEEKTDE